LTERVGVDLDTEQPDVDARSIGEEVGCDNREANSVVRRERKADASFRETGCGKGIVLRKSIGFRSPVRVLLAAACSLLAVGAVAAYTTAPVAENPSLNATYSLARSTEHGAVQGVVKSAGKIARTARVVVAPYSRNGRALRVKRMRVNRHGRFFASLQAEAASVTVTIRVGARTVRATFKVVRGRTINLTAVFPPRRSGLIPGLFPY